jgi:hypothetical protein
MIWSLQVHSDDDCVHLCFSASLPRDVLHSNLVMASGEDPTEWPDRFNNLRKILERSSPFAHPDFEPSSDVCITF